jgi:transposase
MANLYISMSKIRQLLRLYSQGESKQAISRLTGVSRNTLKKYIRDYEKLKLNIIELEELSDHDLEELFSQFKLHREQLTLSAKELIALLPEIDKQLKRKGVTQQLLWEQYKASHPYGLGSSQFGYYYSLWKQQVNPVMHITHKAGDKMFVDYAGEKLHIIDKHTGELKEVEVFVAILGCSQLTYVEASYSQQKEELIASCTRSLHFIGGVPNAIVTDNLKSAVTKSSKYEPLLNEAFADFAAHYSIAVLPTRAYKPKDKALVEGAVKIIYTRIYTKIRDQNYFSLEELNAAIIIALRDHNNMLLQNRHYSRRSQFEEIERNTLHSLPPLAYQHKQHHYVTVMKNGHVCLATDKHYYSVPYTYIGKKVKLLYNTLVVEIFYNYQCIAFHKRLKSPYNYTTNKEHLASTHRFVSEWTAERFLNWGATIDEAVRQYIYFIFEKKEHEEQAYKSCMGVLSMEKRYGKERLINACKKGIEYEMYGYKAIDMILKRDLDKQETETQTILAFMPKHDNIRGKEYYK